MTQSLAAILLFGTAAPLAATADHSVKDWSLEIKLASKRFGIPQEWVRQVMEVESGGRTSRLGFPIVSSAGAMGLMQLMPETWEEMRKAHRLGPDPFDPRDNILAGTAYLRAMYDRFGYPGLFAAYNAGPRRYERFLSGERLPHETVRYVERVALKSDASAAFSWSSSNRHRGRDFASSPAFAFGAAPSRKSSPILIVPAAVVLLAIAH